MTDCDVPESSQKGLHFFRIKLLKHSGKVSLLRVWKKRYVSFKYKRYKPSAQNMKVVIDWSLHFPLKLTLSNISYGNDVGDEFHYLFQCSYFTRSRKLIIPFVRSRHANIISFKHIMCEKNYSKLLKLSKFFLILFCKLSIIQLAYNFQCNFEISFICTFIVRKTVEIS